ncbi:MAG TPA: OsmC family protein [Geobacterales bacterium]|nr:OsmC family protein [Geobacterales bacterium]
MEMTIRFGGGQKVNAEFDGYLVSTDQPGEDGSPGAAPSPFQYFLASIGTCAGIYVLSFCQQRGIPTEQITLSQRMSFESGADGKRQLAKVNIDINLPADFPEKYRNAVVKAAELCTVKKTIAHPPEFEVMARIGG